MGDIVNFYTELKPELLAVSTREMVVGSKQVTIEEAMKLKLG